MTSVRPVKLRGNLATAPSGNTGKIRLNLYMHCTCCNVLGTYMVPLTAWNSVVSAQPVWATLRVLRSANKPYA